MRRRLVLAALLMAPGAAWAASDSGEKKKGGGASYIQIQPLTATVTKRNGRRGVLTVETGIDVPDKALRNRADASVPRLRAAFAQVLMSYAAGLAPDTPPNADYLAREFQRQTDNVLGKPGAKLLLGTILIN